MFGPMAMLAIWQIGSMITTPLFLPPPVAVWKALIGLAESGQLLPGLVYSFVRITAAAALSIGTAIPIACLVYGVPILKETVMPVISFLRYIPVTAFSPLLVLWFGIGEQMKISFLFIATFVYFLPSVLLCFDEVNEELLEVGKTFGFGRWGVMKEILLPMSLPSICKTFLMMYGIGWTYCAIAEASNAKYGLGYIIEISAARGKTAVVFAAIVVIMAFSFAFDRIGDGIIKRIFSWKYD